MQNSICTFIVLLFVFETSVVSALSRDYLYKLAENEFLISTLSDAAFNDINHLDKIDFNTQGLQVWSREFEFPIIDHIQFKVDRYYHSHEVGSASENSLWRWSFAAHIEQDSEDMLTLHLWDGTHSVYNLSASNQYINEKSKIRVVHQLKNRYQITVNQVNYIFDQLGKLVLIVGPNNQSIKFEYKNKLLRKIDLYDVDSIFVEYNNREQIDKITYPNGKIYRYEYKGDELVKVTDHWGNFVDYDYSDEGLKTISTSLGEKIDYQYIPQLKGLLIKRIKNDKLVTDVKMQGGRMGLISKSSDEKSIAKDINVFENSSTLNDGNSEEHFFWHDRFKQLPIKYINDNGQQVDWYYNDDARLTSVKINQSPRYYIEYDQQDRVTNLLSPRGVQTTLEYNPSDRSVTKRVNGKLEYEVHYNSKDLIDQIIDSEDTLTIQYAKFGIPHQLNLNDSFVVELNHDDFFRSLDFSINNFQLFDISYSNDELKSRIVDNLSEQSINLQEYLTDDLSQTVTDKKNSDSVSRGNKKYNSQDSSLSTLPLSLNTTNFTNEFSKYTYNSEGKLIRVLTGRDVLDLFRDENNQVLLMSTNDEKAYAFGVDDKDRIEKISYPSGLEVSYDYDEEGRIINVNSNQVVEYLIEQPDMARSLEYYSNGIVVENRYNKFGDIESTKIRLNSQLLDDINYHYNNSRKMVSVTASNLTDNTQANSNPTSIQPSEGIEPEPEFFEIGYLIDSGEPDVFNVEQFINKNNLTNESSSSLFSLINQVLANLVSGKSAADQSSGHPFINLISDIIFLPDGRMLAFKGFKENSQSSWFYFHYADQQLRAISDQEGRLVGLYNTVLFPDKEMAGDRPSAQHELDLNLTKSKLVLVKELLQGNSVDLLSILLRPMQFAKQRINDFASFDEPDFGLQKTTQFLADKLVSVEKILAASKPDVNAKDWQEFLRESNLSTRQSSSTTSGKYGAEYKSNIVETTIESTNTDANLSSSENSNFKGKQEVVSRKKSETIGASIGQIINKKQEQQTPLDTIDSTDSPLTPEPEFSSLSKMKDKVKVKRIWLNDIEPEKND